MAEFDKATPRPCPFCGSGLVSVCNTGVYWVRCESCSSDGPTDDFEHQAIESWNTRAVNERDADKALIKELVEALAIMVHYADDARSPYIPGSGPACDWKDARDKRVKSAIDLLAKVQQ